MFKFVENNKIVMQIILGLVALTFVGFGVSSYSSVAEDPYLVKVGDTKIFLRDVDRELEGQPVDANAKQRALQALIERDLLLNAIKQNGLVVADAQLQQAIAAIPAFQENGQFSLDKYKAFLANRQMTAGQFEARVSQDVLLKNQLVPFVNGQIVSRAMTDHVAAIFGESRRVSVLVLTPQSFASQVKMDDAAVGAYYKANLSKFVAPERVRLSYVLLSQAALAQQVSVGSDELKKYYDQHQAEFGQEQRRASHILLAVPAGASADQVARVKAQAEALLKDVRANPAKFAELAREHSQDPGSAAKGGDLGFFARGAMVKPFDDAVFSLKPGQIGPLVRSEYGFHIIRLDQIKQPDFDSVKDQVAQQLKMQKAAVLFRTQSDSLSEIAYQQADSLKGVQTALKLVPVQSDWLTRTPAGNDPILSNPKVLAAAFTSDVLQKKHNSEPIDLGNNTLVVLRVTDHQPAHQLKLNEVRDQIKAEQVATEGAKLAAANGQALLAQLKAGKAGAVVGWSAEHQISRQTAASLPPEDLQAIFSASASKLPSYAGLKHNTGEYVIFRVSKIIPAPALTADQRSQLGNMIANSTANAQIGLYLNGLRQKFPLTVGKQQLVQSQDE